MRGTRVGCGRIGRAAVVIAWLALSACGHSIDVGGGTPLPPPGPQFLYATNSADGTVSVFTVDHKNGNLTFVQSVSAGGPGAMGIASSSGGRHLYVANETHSLILGFNIASKTGLLTPTSQGSVSTGAGTGPLALNVPPIGTRLYAVDTLKQQIFSYSISRSSGVLKALPNSPTPPALTNEKLVSITTASASQEVYVADRNHGIIVGYPVNSDGSLNASGAASIGSLGSSGSGEPMWLSNDPAGGNNIFDADALGGPGGSVSVFSVGVGGSLVPVGVFSVGHTINFPLSLTLSPTLPFLYTANGASGDVTNFSILSGGALSRDSKFQTPFPNASSIAIDTGGNFSFVLDPPDALIFQNSINATTGEFSVLAPAIPTENPANPAAAPFQIIVIRTPST